VAFPDAGVSENEHVIVLLDEPAGSEFENQCAIYWVEVPVERIERLAIAEHCMLDPAVDEPVPAALQLVVYEQSKKVQWPEAFGAGLLRANGKHLGHPAQPKLT
jgi:hypothetical protein